MKTKNLSYIQLSYDELSEDVRKKALRQVKGEYRRILSDDDMLIRLIKEQRTSFHKDGSLYDLIPCHGLLVTGGSSNPTGYSDKDSTDSERLQTER
jgi:hypothetical protein